MWWLGRQSLSVPNWDGYIRINSSHRTHAIRSTHLKHICLHLSPRCIYHTLMPSDLRSLAKNWREVVSYQAGFCKQNISHTSSEISAMLEELLYVVHVCPCNRHWDLMCQNCHPIIPKYPSAGFFCKLAKNLRVECKSCNLRAVKLLRRLLTDATWKKITIILYLKQIFIQNFSGLPFFLRITKSLRIKKLLCLNSLLSNLK